MSVLGRWASWAEKVELQRTKLKEVHFFILPVSLICIKFHLFWREYFRVLFACKVQIYKNSHGGYDQISHALYNIHGWYRCCQAVSPTNGMGTRLMHNKRRRTHCAGT